MVQFTQLSPRHQRVKLLRGMEAVRGKVGVVHWRPLARVTRSLVEEVEVCEGRLQHHREVVPLVSRNVIMMSLP